MEVWLLEFVRGVGRLFLQPFLYVFIFCNIIVGYYRVKKERKNFSVRVHDMLYELRTSLGTSIGLGLLVSIVTVGLGLVVPLNIILFVAIGAIIFSLSFSFRFASPAYIIPLAVVGALLFKEKGQFIFDIDLGLPFSIVSLAGIVGLLLIGEVYLVKGSIKHLPSPVAVIGKRGKKIGMHIMNRLWLVPLLLLVPVGDITSFASWWPVASIGESSYALFFIPFPIGFVQKISGSVPKQYLSRLVREIMMLAIFVLVLALASYWLHWIGYVALGIALIGRIFIDVRAANIDKKAYPYFVQRNIGLIVLGVVPTSPAHKMGIEVGEVVTKVNGITVHSSAEFYQALQKNRAFCKLEVTDINGEPRLVQGALYQGEHYELGILHLYDKNEL